MKLLQSPVVMIYKQSINPIINLNLMSSHYMQDSIYKLYTDFKCKWNGLKSSMETLW
jgi:hypothetical protein